MTEFDDLFAEWGNDAQGEPLPLVLETYQGSGQRGDVWAEPVELPGLPREGRTRLVRGAQGDERTSTLTIYAPPEHGPAFTLGSIVVVEGRRTAVLAVAHHVAQDLGDYFEIAVE